MFKQTTITFFLFLALAQNTWGMQINRPNLKKQNHEIGFLVIAPDRGFVGNNETLSDRGKLYEKRVADAINNPAGENELKNIYFGIVMGFSAMIPTAVHIACALFSMRLFFRHGAT